MYTIENDKIIIHSQTDFVPMHILECGQIFRYKKTDDGYIVYSGAHRATIRETGDKCEICSDDTAYFADFFDLDTDYTQIKDTLSSYSALVDPIRFGHGIRILRNDLFEMIISFIISANNNIPRIQKSIEYIATHLGEDKGDYHAFPTINALASADEEFFVRAGTGYRAPYLVDTIAKIADGTFDLAHLLSLDTDDARKYLLTLKGVGTKVADCILLFGMHRLDVFPVDTWIDKIYRESLSTHPLTDRAQISSHLASIFGDLSGYAQQYLFYFRRSQGK